jgi:multidrug efflux system outer membrane protein
MKRSAAQALTALALAASFLTLNVQPAMAVTEPVAPAGGRTVVITPATLRSALLRSNYGVLESLNLIHQAKDQVNIARGNLLPRLNLGAMLSSVSNFGISSISFLLPFLLPTNWANLHQSEDLLESQKIGYRLVELNNYATAYTLYTTMQGDNAIREALVSEYNDLVSVRDYLIQRQKFVDVAQEDIDRADSEVKLSRANISTTDEMLVRERASLREALALPLSVNLTLSDQTVPASSYEGSSVLSLAKRISAVAPENTQIAYLIRAAGEVKFSKEFSFFSGASLNVGVGSSGTPSFNNLSAGAQFSIGFDYVPNITLANDNILNLQIRVRELRAQQAQLAESTLDAIQQAKLQVQQTGEAETELRSVFSAEFRKYTLGLTDLLNVLDAERTVATATATKAKAQADVDSLRVTLHRELLTDQFASIPGCRIRPGAEEEDKGHFFSKLFNSKKYTMAIDEACQPAL